jgi:UDP-N-acetylmuramate: L-alanyl-gamma-D-glutamyl-meso-diaminopimelate ligase
LHNLYPASERLYFLPVGGTAMAPLAGLLQALGHQVRGVDSALYPPMSTLLDELEIEVRVGFDPAAVPRDIDRVIIGNAVPRSNPEVVEVRRRGVPFLSQAEAVAHYVLARGPDALVVAGTHGKTTTTSLLAWILEAAGADPSYLIGGMPAWNRHAFRLGGGPWMVIEGDEYNTAFFDRGAKFLHYRPHLFLIGPVEYDHADLYPSLEAVLSAFRTGAAQVPATGAVVVNGWSEHAQAAARDATAPVVRVGAEPDSDLVVSPWTPAGDGGVAEICWRGGGRHRLALPLPGEHNLHNAAMALAAARTVGVDIDAAVDALARFPGVERRMQTIGTATGITVVDDFAHHPTALGVTVVAARQRWPGRRLVVAFEPRSLTAARRDFGPAYLEALARADLVLVAAPFHADRLSSDEVLDRAGLADGLAERGVAALMPEPDDDPVEVLLPELRSGDVVIGCSSGSFDGFHRRLLAELSGSGSGQ